MVENQDNNKYNRQLSFTGKKFLNKSVRNVAVYCSNKLAVKKNNDN
jgi:hypothetical protein